MRILILLLSCLPSDLFGQHSILFSASDVNALAAGQSGVAQWKDGNGLINPSQLPFISQSSLEISGKNHYLLADLFSTSLSFQSKLGDTRAFSFHLIREGSVDYSESLVNLNYGLRIGTKAAIGIGFNGFFVQQTERKPSFQLSGNLGIRTLLGKDVLIGCVVHNPFAFWQNTSLSLPFHYAAGLNYKIYQELEVQAEIQKEGFAPALMGFGFNYRPFVPLEFGVGVQTSGPNILAGFSYHKPSHYRMAYTANFHFLLGLSSSFSFRYLFKLHQL